MGLVGKSSQIGTLAVSPYTVADYLNTSDVTPASPMTSVSATVKAELFPPHIRALGVGLPYAISLSIFGGTAEYVALWFRASGSDWGYAAYVTAIVSVTLFVFFLIPETRPGGWSVRTHDAASPALLPTAASADAGTAA